MGPVTAIIIAATVIISIWAFDKPAIFEKLVFRPDDVLARKQYYRLASSALVHADYFHLFFNMICLTSFAVNIEVYYGPFYLLMIYLSSIVGGGLLSSFLHRHEDYSAVGASGGVCGVLFSYLFLFPGSSISLLFLPLAIPGWLFAPLFIILSMIGIKKGGDGVGHDAHLGGALIGLGVTTLYFPKVIAEQPFMYSMVVGFSVSSIYILVRKPGTFFQWPLNVFRGRPYQSNIRYQKYDEAIERALYKEEMDKLLDKMIEKGRNGLSRSERKRMEQLSKLIHGSKE